MNELSEKKIKAIRVILAATEEEAADMLRLMEGPGAPEKGDCQDDE